MYSARLWRAVGLALLMGVMATRAHAELTELAFYHLGEDDPGAVVGGEVTTSVESLGTTPGLDMQAVLSLNDIKYSDDVPSYTTSSRSVTFNEFEGYLAAPATPWWTQYAGFRVGMEAFLKVDPAMQGLESVPFTDGSEIGLRITADGFYETKCGGPGITPVNYGEWQHVAFLTTGSFWQIYVDGVPQLDPLGECNYGGAGGEATLGNANGGGVDFMYEGLIDEHRVFTWNGAFNPADLLWFTLRPTGDINDDGVVNEEDYNIWLQNVGVDISGLTLLEGRALGDANGDRQIDLDDFGIIKENRSSGATFGSIPEPGSCILLLIGVIASAALLRRHPHALKRIAIVATIVVLSQPGDLFAQAVWGGGDGNWNDANWTGGTGTGGAPTWGDTVVLPSSTGTLTVSNNLGIIFDQFQQQGGILNIEPAGVLEFSGLARNGLGTDDTGAINLAGQLLIDGGFDVAFDTGVGLTIDGSAVLRVAGTMDTWWTGAAFVSVTGGNADIEVGNTFYLGPTATLEANIDSSTFSTFKVLGDLSFQGGTLDVNFIGGFTPDVGDSWVLFDATTRAGEIPNVNIPDVGPGILLGVNYSAGGNLGQVVTLDFDSTLNLQVNASNGNATIENPAAGAGDLDIDGYIIRSETDSLNEAGFTGLGETGWLPGLPPGQSDGLLSETNFTGSTLVSGTSSYGVGQVFNTAGSQDLTFEFHVAGGGTVQGTVEYITESCEFEADFNCDGKVDGDDFLLWQNGFGIQSGATKTDGDYNNDGKVDGDDFLGWQAEFGSTSGGNGSAAVPEPSAIVVALLAALGALAFARRR